MRLTSGGGRACVPGVLLGGGPSRAQGCRWQSCLVRVQFSAWQPTVKATQLRHPDSTHNHPRHRLVHTTQTRSTAPLRLCCRSRGGTSGPSQVGMPRGGRTRAADLLLGSLFSAKPGSQGQNPACVRNRASVPAANNVVCRADGALRTPTTPRPGGETMILKRETLDFWSGFVSGRGLELDDIVTLVPPKFNQLTVGAAPRLRWRRY